MEQRFYAYDYLLKFIVFIKYIKSTPIVELYKLLKVLNNCHLLI